MLPLAHTALAASIVLSALGAVIICALTAFYGFTPEGEEPVAEAHRRRLLTRVGHAMAAACFASTAILLAVVLAQPTRPGSAPAVDTRVPALDARVEAQALRLEGVEQRMKDSEQTLQRLEMEVSEVSAHRMGQDGSPAALEAPAKEAAPRPRAASVAPPKPAAVKPTPSAAKPAERPTAVVAPSRPKQRERPTVVVAPPPVTPSTERAATPPSEPAASPSVPSPMTPPAAPPASMPSISTPPASTPSAITPPAAVPATSPLSSRPSGASHGAAAAAPREPAPASSSGLIGKFRDDWRAIQRGWENASEDFRKATAPLRGEN